MPFNVPNIFVPSTVADANAVNANFTAVVNAINNIQPSTSLGQYLSTASASFSASQNVININNDLAIIAAAGGGTYIFPNELVQINQTIQIGSGAYWPLTITAVGRQGGVEMTENLDTFVVNFPGANQSQYGIRFQDFYIHYTSGLTSGVAIRIAQCQHSILDGMTIQDAPIAYETDNTLQSSVFRCVFRYKNNTSPPGQAMVMIGNANIHGDSAVETFIANCTFFTEDINGGGAGGNGLICGTFEHVRLYALRLEGFEQGVGFFPNTQSNIAVKIHMEDIVCETGTTTTNNGAAFAFCPVASKSTYEITAINCRAHGQTGGNTNYTGAGFVIDATGAYNGGSNVGSSIEMVRIIAPLFNGWNGPGMSIINNVSNTIQNVDIDGGHLCSNGQTQSGGNAAGLLINGPVTACNVRGLTCNNLDSETTGGPQTYGIYFDNGGGAEVSSCSLGGNVTGAIGVGTPGTILATNNAGYNFSGTVVTTTPPTSGVAIGAAGAGGYYGPSVVYVTGGSVTSITQGFVTQRPTGLTSGTFYLQAGESFKMNYTGSPTVNWLGL